MRATVIERDCKSQYLAPANCKFAGTGSLKIYPNPASSVITIETEGVQTINIYNALGQLVKSVTTKGTKEVRLDVSEWASGAYLVEGLGDNGFKKVGRFVK